MIASENFVPQAVLDAAGSVLTNKYAEGYPGRRYYGGCEEVDVAEQLAIDRAKELFGAEHANVQPHAGAQANNAAYMAMLEPGRHDHGHGARPRRPPDARDEAERLGQALRGRRLPRPPRGPPRRHGRGRAARRGAQAEGDRRRLVAPTRASSTSPPSARSPTRSGRKLMVDMAHFAGPRRRRRAPEPGRARRRRHDHDPQDALRPAQRHDPLPRGARQGHQPLDLPRPAGRPADAHHRRQGRGARGSRPTEPFRARQRQTIANAQAFGEELIAGGVDVLTGGTDVHLVLVDLGPDRARRQDRRGAPRGGRDHRQPQRDPVRRAPADEPVRACGSAPRR